MKLKELLAFKLEKTFIFEMAHSRRKAWEMIKSVSYPISEHVVKLLIFPNSSYTKHWIQEIDRWVDDIQDIFLTPQNRRLAFIEYRDWLVDEPEYNPLEFVKRLQRKYPNEHSVISPTLRQDFSNIMVRISNELATGTFDGIQKYFE